LRCEEDSIKPFIGYQIHKHSATCYKRKKKVCRFGFPKPPLPSTHILEPLDSNTPVGLKVEAEESYQKIKDRLNEMGRAFTRNIPFEEFLQESELNMEKYILAISHPLSERQCF